MTDKPARQVLVTRPVEPHVEPPPVTQYIVVPRRSPLVRFLRVVFSLLILLAAGYGIYSMLTPEVERERVEAAADPAAALEAHRRESLEAEAGRKSERQAMLKERIKATLDRGARLRQRAGDLGAEAAAWEKNIVPLLATSEGKFLTAERHWVDSFEEAFKTLRPGYAAADELLKRLEILLEPIQQAWDAGDWSSPPGGSLDDRLAELEREIDQQISAAKAPRLKIESLLLAAKEEGAKGERTMEEAIQFFKAQAEARAATASRRAKQKAEDDAEAEMQREREELARQEEQQKLGEAERETAKAELQALLKKSKTKQLLAPFSTPGFFQPDRSMSATKMPISYSKLVGAGCLDESERGLDRLRNLVKDNTDKIRPRWDMNHYLENLPTEAYEKLASAQAFLREHGELLVELGVLSP